MLIWLMRAPYRPALSRGGAGAQARGAGPRRHRRRRRARCAACRWSLAMVVLAGAASFFVGNSYQAQMPGFAQRLGSRGSRRRLHHPAGRRRGGRAARAASCSRAAASCWRLARRARSKLLAVLGRVALLCFALTRQYWLALPLLFLAGFFELSFSSMAQTLVQLDAPEEARGRVLGLFSMSSSGLRTFSGVTVGLAGSLTDIHTSLSLSAAAFLLTIGLVLFRTSRAPSRARGDTRPGDTRPSA